MINMSIFFNLTAFTYRVSTLFVPKVILIINVKASKKN